MVSTTPRPDAAPAASSGDPAGWIAALAPDRRPEELDILRRAAALAVRAHSGQTRASGEPYIEHTLAVARILTELRLDTETLAAAILHDVVEDTGIEIEEIERDFGRGVARLVDGVTKMQLIHRVGIGQAGGGQAEDGLHGGERPAQHAQAESLRKMLLAMAEDVRVVLIKLADRLHNMRTLGALPEAKQQRIARETLDIFAPLANRLGIWQVKWELEDLSFRYLEPEPYRRIAALLAERRTDRESYIERFMATLQAELASAGVQAEISGRPKHIYGIWRKMQRKHKSFEQITDLRGVRIHVGSVRDCYAALGVVHGRWTYIAGEFDDYIATPKENHYRSIHTAVIGPEGKTVEVQIRTHDMHREAELGVAAHWRYKEGRSAESGFDAKIAWLRSLLEWKDEVAGAVEFVDQFKSEVFSERVYVFTPKGNIVDLPAGATPLDFAYHIHSDVGHRCRGAKVDGRIVPLTYPLQTGERVEVLTVKEGSPSRDWLSPQLGYLHTSKARSKVSHWFRQQNYEVSVAAGRETLERELQRQGLGEVNFVKLAGHFGHAKVDDFLAALGRGEVRPGQIASAMQDQGPPRTGMPESMVRPAAPRKPTAGVTIEGLGNLLSHMAKCCNPLPGDPIVGFITRGRGVTVHRSDCPNALRHRDEGGERLIEVLWGGDSTDTYPVEIQITAYDRPGLLRDVTGVLANEKINVVGVSTATDRDQVAHMTFTLLIPGVEILSHVLALIDRVPNVMEVRRKMQ